MKCQLMRTLAILCLLSYAHLGNPTPANARETIPEIPDLHIATGVMSQYAPGKMQEVIRVRQTPGRTDPALPSELPEVTGWVAMRDPEWIGQQVVVCFEETGQCETFLVVDCAGIADGGYAWMTRNNIVAEMDFESAVRHNVGLVSSGLA